MAEYIEREAAIRETYKEPSYYDPINILTEVRDRIRAIPAADVRPVGKWNWTVEGDEDYEQFWVCSRCGAKMHFATNYCPNCGAKMKGVEDKS